MNRLNYPNGQSKSLVAKALLRYLEAVPGTALADAWLKSIDMVRDDLEDETRTIPMTSLVNALRSFVKLTSREAIAETSSYFIAPDALGAWMRILRGAHDPAEALAQLDAEESEYSGKTMRWETLEAGASSWRGRVHLTHDPELESDGLLILARLTELSAIPALFGLGRATFVACRPSASVVGICQDFEVRWRRPHPLRLAAVGAVSGFFPPVIALLALSASLPSIVVTSVLGMALGGVAGALLAREHGRRAETLAQTARVHALERSMLLREDRERATGGSLQGSVVAGQYRIKEQMGSGASGVIYEAVRIADGFPVALKLLRVAAAHDVTASDRLRREAEALGLSWHPNVVEVIEQGHLPDGTSYLVMELLQGESLHAHLRNKGRIGVLETFIIGLQVCDALAAVHAAGVVHRDLKPSNIFLSFDSSRLEEPTVVKLLDFGIARVEWEETRITNIGSPLGTPGYMSPEQELGGDIDARSDLYSLGAVLYECLVGEAPPARAASGVTLTYPGLPANLFSVFDRKEKKFEALVPLAWQNVIAKAMAPHPADRFQSAREFATALRALQESDAEAVENGTEGY